MAPSPTTCLLRCGGALPRPSPAEGADGAVNLVFANKSSAARFSKWLKAVITAPGTQQDLLDMCLIISDIGTHSFRKGIAVYLQHHPAY